MTKATGKLWLFFFASLREHRFVTFGLPVIAELSRKGAKIASFLWLV
jgi:hypothetical protein